VKLLSQTHPLPRTRERTINVATYQRDKMKTPCSMQRSKLALVPSANMAGSLDGDLDPPLAEIFEAIAVLGARHLASSH